MKRGCIVWIKNICETIVSPMQNEFGIEGIVHCNSLVIPGFTFGPIFCWPVTFSAKHKWSATTRFPFCRWRENGVSAIPIQPPSLPTFFRLSLGVEMGPTNQTQHVFIFGSLPHRSPAFSATTTDARDREFPLTRLSARQCATGCFTELSKVPFIPLCCCHSAPHLEYAMEANAPTLRLLQGPSYLRWRSSAFSLCVVKYWNGLLASLVMWPSVCVFEKQSMAWIHRHFSLPLS